MVSKMERILRTHIVSLFFLSMLWFPTANAGDPLMERLPSFKIMHGMSAQWVAEKMSYNGLPMSVQTFATSRSVQEVLSFYDHRWKSLLGGQISRSRSGEFETVGVQQGDYFLSVQARPAQKGSEGTLVVSATPQSRKYSRDERTRFPLVPGSDLVSKIESMDAGIRAETLVIVNDRSAKSNDVWLSAALNRKGWAKQKLSTEQQGFTERVLNFQKGSQLCQVAVVENSPEHQGRTMMLVNWIKGR